MRPVSQLIRNAALLLVSLGVLVGCEPPKGDLCAGIDCGPMGHCREVGGSAVCECIGGYHPEGGQCVANSDAGAPDGEVDPCGNGVADEGEMCDGADLRGETCVSLGGTGGELACKPHCKFYDTGDCQTTCGDGFMGGDEQCDGADLGSVTCEDLGYYGGPLACDAACGYDTSGCTGRCGDGELQMTAGEECDASNLDDETCSSLGFYGGSLGCYAPGAGNDLDCTYDVAACEGYCGDGSLQPAHDEVCDESNLGGETCASLGYDSGVLACAQDCESFDVTGCHGLCGDGIVESGSGEECDDGSNDPGDGCSATCQVELGWECSGSPTSVCDRLCGNGAVDVETGYTEVCDGSPLATEDCTDHGFYGGTLRCAAGCLAFDTALCVGECGDDEVNGTELCDDTDHDGQDCTDHGFYGGTLACSGTCDAFVTAGCIGECGDSTVQPGDEDCDGGIGADDCTTIGQGFTGGTLACVGCQWDTSGCTTQGGCTDVLSDDFSDGTVDPWIIDDGSVSVTGERLLILRTGGAFGRVRQDVSWSGAFEFEADIQLYTDQSAVLVIFDDGGTQAYYLRMQTLTQNANQKGIVFNRGDGTTLIQQLFDPGTAQSHHVKVTLDSAGNWELFLNGGSIGTAADSTHYSFDAVRMIGMQDSVGGHGGYVDNVVLRSCGSSQPGPCIVTESWTKEATNPVRDGSAKSSKAMFDNGAAGLGAVYASGNGYQTANNLTSSSDGVSWSAGTAFISPSDVGRSEITGLAVYLDSGTQPATYHAFVGATNDTTCHDTQDVFHLTSMSPPTWTNHGVVLSASGSDETRGLRPTHVLREGGLFYLYYDAVKGSGCSITDYQVALATSSDGSSWQKVGVVIPNDTRATDTLATMGARVFTNASGWHMAYQEQDGSSGDVYYAWSDDGLSWIRSDTPFVARTQAWENGSRLAPLGFTDQLGSAMLFYGAWSPSYVGTGLATTTRLCEPYCGDGYCDLEDGENSSVCPQDCGCDTEWTWHASSPVFANVRPMSVVWTGTRYLMYAWPKSANSISVYESTDGVAWTLVQSNVIGSNITGHSYTRYVTVIKDGSTYKAWATGTSNVMIASAKLYYATSSDGISWTGQGMVVDNGAAGTYDSRNIDYPVVLKEGGTYHLWYKAIQGDSGSIVYRGIAYATSSDGVTWNKHGMVMQEPEARGPGDVEKIGDRYVMWYDTAALDGIHRAVSADGINWVKDPDNPVVPNGTTGDYNQVVVKASVDFDPGGRGLKMWVNADLNNNPSVGLLEGTCASGATCNNGYVETGEECDDGNHRSHDGCSSCCTTETPNWEEVFPSTVPTGRVAHGSAYDSSLRKMIVFGGATAPDVYSEETLEYSNGNWVIPTLTTKPERRTAILGAMAYMDKTLSTVLFGGYNYTLGHLNDTWEYDGSVWRKLGPTSSPTARSNTGIAYDSLRQRLVMFGGGDVTSGGFVLDDTWVFNGITWQRLYPADVPPARRNGGLAYDPDRDRVVLYGGWTGSSNLGDTWEFDGENWVELFPVDSPSDRHNHKLVYDPRRGAVVFWGGHDNFDMWEYDGTNWVEVFPNGAPASLGTHAVVYDQAESQLVLFGGGCGGPCFENKTWVHQWRAPVCAAEVCDNTTDDDSDGYADCLDPDCDGVPCASGWCVGGACVDPCDGVTCSGQGTCTAPGGIATCACNVGYHAVGLTCVANFTAAEALPEERWAHTATSLNDGKVLVVGGQTLSNGYLGSALTFDPTTESWASAGSLTTARYGHSAVRLPDDTVLVASGVSAATHPQCVTSAERYTPGSGWSGTDALTECRWSFPLVMLQNGIAAVLGGEYHFGGTYTYAARDSVEWFNHTTGLWSPGGTLGTERAIHTATVLNDGRVFVAGGYTWPAGTHYTLATTELYDASGPSATPAATMSDRRNQHTATLLPDGRVLIVGGYYIASPSCPCAGVGTAVIYDPDQNDWTATGAMSTQRQAHSATLLPNGEVLVAGGHNYAAAASLTSAEIYDPATNIWRSAGTMTVARRAHTATLLPDGRVLLVGGYDNGNPIAAVEIFSLGL